MNFEHTEDRRMIAQSLGRYIKEQYPFDVRDKITKSDQGYSKSHWQDLAQMGIIAALFTESNGGYGGSGFDLAVIFEELGRGLIVEPFLGALMSGVAIAESNSSQWQNKLADIIEGKSIGAFAHVEPNQSFSLTKVMTTATPTANGWLLNGAKAVVSHARAADFLIVSARSADTASEESDLSLFVLPTNINGIEMTDYPLIDGGRAADIKFNNVELDADALLGTKGQAYGVIEKTVGTGLLALCAESLGAMEVAKEETLEYLRTRKQFNTPIGSFQALQHRMVDVLLEIEQARSSVIRAASAFVSEDRLEREKALSAAKYTIGKAGSLVAEEAIQLHGGIGMTWELTLSHYAKRLIMVDHQLGDEDYHLQRFISLGNKIHV